MNDPKKIINALQKGDLKPIYFLYGEEPYFIDTISDYIEKSILTTEEKEFNQTILYGNDVNVEQVVATAKRFPMMADRQVVILKEAQGLSTRHLQSKLSEFEPYFANPQPSTVLVVCLKYKNPDKRKKYYKTVKKNGVVFEAKKLYDNKIPGFIKDLLRAEGYTITPKAAQVLSEFLGNDLGKIHNELAKLKLITPQGTQITPDIIEQNIGFSKDFNNFELQNALGAKDFKKAFRIINYFAQNPKDNPILGTIPLLFRYFSQLLIYHGLKDKSKRNVASKLGVNPYFVDSYRQASRSFPMKKCSYAIGVLRDIDMRVKGVESSSSVAQGDFLKELLVKLTR